MGVCMWFSLVFTAIHDLSMVTAGCLLAYAVAGTESCFVCVLFGCCCTLLSCFLVFTLLFMFEVLNTPGTETHALLDILDSMTSHIMDQPEVCGCTAGLKPMLCAGLVNQLQDYGTCLWWSLVKMNFFMALLKSWLI